jgi:hypothetical protein
MEKIKTKMEIELNSFQLKSKASLDEFKKKRGVEFDKLLLQFKNKTKELENNQKLEINNFSKIMKGIASNNLF